MRGFDFLLPDRLRGQPAAAAPQAAD